MDRMYPDWSAFYVQIGHYLQYFEHLWENSGAQGVWNVISKKSEWE